MIWTAIIMGFAGSLHCAGMCSPLVMAVSNISRGALVNRIIYNTGRVLTYGLMGSVVATVGLAFPLIKYQNLLSILLGFALLVIGLGGISSLRIPFLTGAVAKINIVLKNLFAIFLKRRNRASTFILGSLNGLLPCGLSFLALTYCLTLAGPFDGFNFMVLFGLGTLPVMLGFTSVFQWAMEKFHFRANKLATTMMILSGALLIARVFFIHLPHIATAEGEIIDIVLCK